MNRINGYSSNEGTHHLKLFTLDYIDRNGNSQMYSVASRRDVPKAISGDYRPDAVVIAPAFNDEGIRKTVLQRQFRPALGKYIIEFPAGKIDPGESYIEAAARELKEETGLILTSDNITSPVLYSSPGMTDESIVIIFCECEGTISTEMNEESEEIEPILMSADDITELLTTNIYNDSPAVFDLRTWIILSAILNSGATI